MIPPVAIDVMIKLEGFSFNEVYERVVTFKDDNLKITMIHKNDLIAAKQKAGRPKDLDDLEKLK